MLRMNTSPQELIIAPRPFLGVRGNYRWIAQIIVVLADAIMVALAFGLAYWLRFHVGLAFSTDAPMDPDKYLELVLILLPVWLILFWIMHLYDYYYLLGGTSEYTRVVNACTTGMMLVVVVSFLFPDYQIARAWLVMSWLLSSLLVTAGRFGLRRVAYRMRRDGYFIAPAIVVGTNHEAVALATQLQDSLGSGLSILGFVDGHYHDTDSVSSAGSKPTTLAGLPILGDLTSLPDLVRDCKIEEVVIATTALGRRQRIQVLETLVNLPHVEMRLSSGLYEIFTTGMKVTTKNSVPLVTPNRLRLNRLENIMKTSLDFGLIALALPALVPLFAVIAVLIKLDSPGPVFHRRRVLGIGGKAFNALKFRSMQTNGDEILAQYPDKLEELKKTHKLKDDPRITYIGRFLRKTSLDELPQLINVLCGQMSLVGPRMISPEEAEMYGMMHLNLLTVKPGITGLWQVSGRSDLSYEERVQLDMHYIRNYSIWWDLQILFVQTIPAVSGKRGAY